MSTRFNMPEPTVDIQPSPDNSVSSMSKDLAHVPTLDTVLKRQSETPPPQSLSKEDLDGQATTALDQFGHNDQLKNLLAGYSGALGGGVAFAIDVARDGIRTRKRGLNALILLSKDRLIDNPDHPRFEVSEVSDVVKGVVSILEESRSSNSTRPADRIATKLRQLLIKPNDQYLSGEAKFDRDAQLDAAFDIGVMTAMARGDEAIAVELMLKVGDVLPKLDGDGTNTAQRDIFARMAPIIRSAMTMLEPHQQRQLAASLSLLGEADTPFTAAAEAIDVKKYPDAKALKTEGERMLKGIAQQDYDEWEGRQKISNVQLREKQLSDDVLDTTIEDAIQKGQSWQDIDQMIRDRAVAITNGKVANYLAPLIGAKMNPQVTVEERIKRAKAEIRGERFANFPDRAYSDGFIAIDYTGKEPKEKGSGDKAALLKNSFRNASVEKVLFDHMGVDFTDLSAVAAFSHLVGEYFQQNKNKLNAPFTSVESVKIAVAKKLIPSIDYLQKCIQDPLIRVIMITEFGFEGFGAANNVFSGLPLPERMQAIKEKSQTEFGTIEDQNAGSDKQSLSEISRLTPTDTMRTANIGRERAIRIIHAKQEEINAQVQDLEQQRATVADSQPVVDDLATKIASTQTAIENLEASRTSNGFWGIGKDKNLPTTEEKAARLTGLRVQLANLQNRQMPEPQRTVIIPDSDLQKAQARLAVITSLYKQSTAT